MLSRTADALYWMARYTERAENAARLLDVSYRMSLQGGATRMGYWGAALGITGLEEAYTAKYGEITAAQVLSFLAVDADNPSSILSCLRAARENCHAVRGTVTSEVWETVNTTWLEARESAGTLRRGRLQGSDLTRYCEWVKFRSHLSRGVTVGTMLRDEAFHFMRLGTFLERADNTARLLDVKFDELAPSGDTEDEYYEWGALLRSVSAFEIYRKVYRDVITPQRVAELLVLHEAMPRSLHACMREVDEILGMVGNARSRDTQRRAGELHARLRFARIEDILEIGLHPYLTQFLERTADLGDRIARDFLVPIAVREAAP
ncbi:MAG: alpha-E domain-containing protein [Betaproteobacteria bacterium]|nr:alpha-E domain-containing protein [Betaproteobacteria bacterium]MDH5222507.1 alpha-E domain-containing protein [Betaproteobacteria bacterium]MDH5352727.1 alpha-E domain-containing protein [Betaproteobacteria bacterium]